MQAFTPQPLFVFYLVNAAGDCFYVDTAGAVQSRGLPAPLGYTPDGWQDMTVGWERNLVKFGLVRNFSLSLGFVGDGAQILEHLYYFGNVDVKVWLFVQKLTLEVTDDDYALIYKEYYKGEIDLSTFRHSRRKVLVNLMEGGRSKEMKAGEATVFQHPVTTARAVTVRMDGHYLNEQGNYVIADGFEISKAVNGSRFLLPFAFLSKEGNSGGVAFFTQDLQDVSGIAFDDIIQLLNYAAIADESNISDIDVHITGTARILCTQNDVPFTISARFLTSTMAVGDQNLYEAIARFIGVPGQVYEKLVDITIPLQAAERLYFEARFLGGLPGAVDIKIFFLPDCKFSVAYKNRHRTTYVKGYLVDTLYSMAVAKFTGNEDHAVSELLSTCPLVVLSGDSLRGITGAFIKTSFNSLINSLCVVHCAGVGVENNKIVLEAREHFINDDIIVDLGEVKELEISPALDVMFNTIKAAYNDQDIDDVNGRLAFNSFTEWTTAVQRIVKALELISEYGADPFEIEIVRRNLDNKTTTDANTDNKNYFACVDRDNPEIEEYLAVRTTPIHDQLPGSSVKFETLTGSAFSADVDKKEFTFIGFAAEPADIDFSIKPTGGSVEVTLYKNAEVLGQIQFIADGNTTNGIAAITTLDNGDVLKVTVLPLLGGNYSVLSARISVNLTGRKIFNLKRAVYTDVQGIPNPETIFNIEHLSIKRILENWYPWFRGALMGFEATSIVQTNNTKNKDLATFGGPGGDYIEKADLLVSMLGDPLFAPQKMSFKATSPLSLITTLKETPRACFRFTYRGLTFKGYLLKCSIASKTNQEQNFILLSHPDNDFKPLENE